MTGILITMLGSFAHAGDKGGNGGGGHFCPDGRSEVYDLQEGRVRYHLPVLTLSGTRNEVIQQGIQKIKAQYPVLARLMEIEVAKVISKMEVLNVKIERTLDSDNLYIEETCDYLQIANWDTTVDRLIISSSRWALLPEAQKGVLLMHEAAYSIYRSTILGLQENATDQYVDPVRKFIAEVYSSEAITSILVKTPFLSGGIVSVPAVNKGSSRYHQNSEPLDYMLVENPYCASSEYVINFENVSEYNLSPEFGAAPGKLIKIKHREILAFDLTSLPARFALQDFTNIERVSIGPVISNSYDPVTSAGVSVTLKRMGCGESGSFPAPCSIERNLGVFKKAQCVETVIKRFPL